MGDRRRLAPRFDPDHSPPTGTDDTTCGPNGFRSERRRPAAAPIGAAVPTDRGQSLLLRSKDALPTINPLRRDVVGTVNAEAARSVRGLAQSLRNEGRALRAVADRLEQAGLSGTVQSARLGNFQPAQVGCEFRSIVITDSV